MIRLQNSGKLILRDRHKLDCESLPKTWRQRNADERGYGRVVYGPPANSTL